MPKVRLSVQPDNEIEVSEEELTDLRRLGLVEGDDKKSETNSARSKNKED